MLERACNAAEEGISLGEREGLAADSQVGTV